MSGAKATVPDMVNSGTVPALGMCFDRTFPPALLPSYARRLEEGGLDELWVVEDCFYTGGVSLAAAALMTTSRLRVGTGILPAVARTAPITAMEIATLCGLAPDRLIAGIGHGVQSWMDQMGVRPASPLRALEEVMVAVRRLLDGETVTVDGQYVRLTDVKLDQPPSPRPPLVAGVRGPRSLELAGRVADGLILAEATGPAAVRWSREQAGRGDDFQVSVFTTICIARERAEAYRIMAPWLADQLSKDRPATNVLPFADDLTAWFDRHGVDGLVTMPPEWWMELGAIGTVDDAEAHVHALGEVGATSVAFFPARDVDIALAQVDVAIELGERLRAG